MHKQFCIYFIGPVEKKDYMEECQQKMEKLAPEMSYLNRKYHCYKLFETNLLLRWYWVACPVIGVLPDCDHLFRVSSLISLCMYSLVSPRNLTNHFVAIQAVLSCVLYFLYYMVVFFPHLYSWRLEFNVSTSVWSNATGFDNDSWI